MNIGLGYPVVAPLNVETGAYSKGFDFGEAVDINMTINYNEAKFSSNNRISVDRKAFKDGSIVLGITAIPVVAYAPVFGHTVDTTSETDVVSIIDQSDDKPKPVGLGIVQEDQTGEESTYVAMWIYKVLFTEPGANAKTQGETITFTNPSISGTILALANKKWMQRKIFKTEAAAIAWIKGLAGITAQCSTPAANVASGTYATTQTVTLTAGAGEAIYYTTNGTTPSATNGTLYSTPVSVAASLAIKAIATKSGSSHSNVSTFEYIIDPD